MSRYDGLIIPRSYSEYINKTDAATLLQALQLSGVMDNAPTENSNHPTKSSGVYTALAGKQATLTFDDAPTANSNNPVKSSGIYAALGKQEQIAAEITINTADWLKLCDLSYMSGGNIVEIFVTNSWNTGGSSARKITVACGIWGVAAYFSNLTVIEEASDPAANFSDIKIIATNNPSSPVSIFIKYARNTANTIKCNIRGCGGATIDNILKKETPTGNVEISYSLHTSGVYVNGQSVI